MDRPPLFTALSTSVRQLTLLLRCIAFAPKAEVTITSGGIRFSVEESRVVQGTAFLESSLFSTYSFNSPDDGSTIPSFQISITALLETLQIFGLSESNTSYRSANGGFSSSYGAAFNTPALALGATCRLSYAEIGAPLIVTIQEGTVETTCEIYTYEMPYETAGDEGIPLDRNAMVLKIIMRSAWLHDAIVELSSTVPTTLVVKASSRSSPFFALEGQGGPFGDSTVDFQPSSKHEPTPSNVQGAKKPLVTETFSVAAPQGSHGRVKQSYKFDLIRRAGRAMALANKVSIRQDIQGVLSLQFMVEVGEAGAGSSSAANGAQADKSGLGQVSFIDFRYVPLVEDDDDAGSRHGDQDSTNSED